MPYLASVGETLRWRSIARTAALCVAIAVLLTLLDVADPFSETLVISCLMGFSFHLTTALIVPISAPRLPWLLTMAVTLTVGLTTGLAASAWYATGDPLFFFRSVNTTLWLGFFFGVIGTAFFSSMAELDQMRERLARSELVALERDKQIAETQLKLLQAQIEPHFLFNTLGNVVSLISSDPAAARRTLENLTTLLRSTLKRTRAEATALGDELDILRSYLDIQRIRMGDRLSYRIEADDALRSERLPPMLLQPLVENAVVHGLAPLENGGEITIHVSATCAELVIDIRDSGARLQPVNGSAHAVGGTGLTNVRARLAALYGGSASVTLSGDTTRTTATLKLPRSAGTAA